MAAFSERRNGLVDATKRTPRSVLAVILNYNGRQWLEKSLPSIMASDYPAVTVCVVDNASSDGSVAWIHAHYPDVLVLENAINRGSPGFNTGMEFGLRHGFDFILKLDNDVEAPTDCIQQMVNFMREHPDVGVLAPLIYYWEPRDTLWFCGGVVDRGRFKCNHPPTVAEFRAAPMRERFITGCASLVRRQVFETIGGCDPCLFLYYDDTDFSIRAADAGFGLEVCEAAHLYHMVSASSGGENKLNATKVYYEIRSSLLFWRKHAGWWRFHRDYCSRHLGKWVNNLPLQWNDPKARPCAKAGIDALWYVISCRKTPCDHPAAPEWFARLMIRRPWLVAELMALRLSTMTKMAAGL